MSFRVAPEIYILQIVTGRIVFANFNEDFKNFKV